MRGRWMNKEQLEKTEHACREPLGIMTRLDVRSECMTIWDEYSQYRNTL